MKKKLNNINFIKNSKIIETTYILNILIYLCKALNVIMVSVEKNKYL